MTPWFVAADAAAVLYNQSNGLAPVYARLKESEQHIITRSGVIGLPLFVGSKAQQIRIVSEAGLYKLIMRSDKPQAKVFQDWVTSVVLPAIRKTGGYVMGEEKVKTGELSMEEMTLRVVSFMQTKLASLEAERVVHIEKLAEQQPAVEFPYPKENPQQTCGWNRFGASLISEVWSRV